MLDMLIKNKRKSWVEGIKRGKVGEGIRGGQRVLTAEKRSYNVRILDFHPSVIRRYPRVLNYCMS